jgi:hypothetical protein
MRLPHEAVFVYALSVSLTRKLAYVAASVIAAAGMMGGHSLAASLRAAGNEADLAQVLGIAGWVVAGIAAVLIDRTVPPRAVAFASLALPLVWFGSIIVSDESALWWLGLLAIIVFALIAGLAAYVTSLAFRIAARRN